MFGAPYLKESGVTRRGISRKVPTGCAGSTAFLRGRVAARPTRGILEGSSRPVAALRARHIRTQPGIRAVTFEAGKKCRRSVAADRSGRSFLLRHTLHNLHG